MKKKETLFAKFAKKDLVYQKPYKNILSEHITNNFEKKCEHCGKSFSEVKNLKKHMYIAHGIHKDHKCETCDNSFS